MLLTSLPVTATARWLVASKTYFRLEDFPRLRGIWVVFFLLFLSVSFLNPKTTPSLAIVFAISNKINKRISMRLHLLSPKNEERDNATFPPYNIQLIPFYHTNTGSPIKKTFNRISFLTSL